VNTKRIEWFGYVLTRLTSGMQFIPLLFPQPVYVPLPNASDCLPVLGAFILIPCWKKSRSDLKFLIDKLTENKNSGYFLITHLLRWVALAEKAAIYILNCISSAAVAN